MPPAGGGANWVGGALHSGAREDGGMPPTGARVGGGTQWVGGHCASVPSLGNARRQCKGQECAGRAKSQRALFARSGDEKEERRGRRAFGMQRYSHRAC